MSIPIVCRSLKDIDIVVSFEAGEVDTSVMLMFVDFNWTWNLSQRPEVIAI